MNQIIYIAIPNNQCIYVFQLNNNGTLKLLQVVNTFVNIHTIVIHPTKNYMYAGSRPNPRLITYSINKYGLLNKIYEISLPGISSYLTIHKINDISIIYSASYHNNSISVIYVDHMGKANLVVQNINNLIKCHAVNVNKINNTLWATCLGEDCIKIFIINKFGVLYLHNKKIINTTKHSGPRHMVFGRYNCNYSCAYVINELSNTINILKINYINNKVNIIQTLNILPFNTQKKWAADIHITPDNNWLYCSERTTNTISCFVIIHNTKQLKLVNFQYTEDQPRCFLIDNSGNYLIVAGEKSNFICVYIINKINGALIPIYRYNINQPPVWMSIK